MLTSKKPTSQFITSTDGLKLHVATLGDSLEHEDEVFRTDANYAARFIEGLRQSGDTLGALEISVRAVRPARSSLRSITASRSPATSRRWRLCPRISSGRGSPRASPTSRSRRTARWASKTRLHGSQSHGQACHSQPGALHQQVGGQR